MIVSSLLFSALYVAPVAQLELPPPTEQAAVAPASAKPAQADKPAFKQEELDQMLAPIALYPDALLTQILIASTYPLEIVEADRWEQANKSLKGDARAKALEQQSWDPSIKSLVDFGAVLDMLSTKLDWTQKLGDAFIGQQKQVMDTVQKLRKKAEEYGQLKTSKDLKVETKPGESTDTITIESTSPTVIYVPSYDPVVAYGPWWYPAYPPYPYYPPGYVAGAAFFSFSMGVAWGYAWGHCNWGHSDVDIDVNRNTSFNTNIDRSKYSSKVGQGGTWKHDPSHRGSVPYRNSATAKSFGGISANDAARARSEYRGRADQGRSELGRGGSDPFGGAAGGDRFGDGGGARNAGSGSGFGDERGGGDREFGGGGSRDGFGSGGGGFSGIGGGGEATRSYSERGRSSRGGWGGGGRGRR